MSGIVLAAIRSGAKDQRSEDWSGLKLGDVGIEASGSSHAEPVAKGVMALLKFSRNGSEK